MAVQIFCPFPGCNSIVNLDTNAQYLREHFSNHHANLLASGIHDCPFHGCCCSRNCRGRGPRHAWHGQNIIRHIFDHHLDFEDVCPKCGRGKFANSFSFNRHVDFSCRGRSVARCTICWNLFPSETALSYHSEFDHCTPLLPKPA
jgi:hypothetical protein